MPTNLQFRNSIFVANAYQGAATTAPVLRTAAGGGINLNNPPANGTHFSLSFPPALPAPRPVASTATTPYVSEGATALDARTGGMGVGFVPPVAGGVKAAYLPFVGSMIASVIVPGDPASNVNFFYTDNLSGCSIFIDRIVGTNDLVVYHANRVDLTVVPNPAQYVATTPFAGQFLAARNAMRAAHTTAQGELVTAMGGGAALHNVGRLERVDYFACVEAEKARKRGQGRTNVDIGAAGTNVMGFRIAGSTWEFWWQTWAILTYDRPWNAPKAILARSYHKPTTMGTAKLIGAQRFFT